MSEQTISKAEAAPEPQPAWLAKWTEHGWQAELLISGGAFVSLLNCFDMLEEIAYFFEFSSELKFGVVAFGTLFTLFGLLTLVTGFFAHLILRGYWVGLVGLNYVFPNGIDSGRAGFTGRFGKLVSISANTAFLVRLDKLCAGIFAMTFLILFSIFGLFVYFSFFMVAFYFIPNPQDLPTYARIAARLILFVWALSGLLLLIDFITGGALKKIRWLSRFYWPLYTVGSMLTMSFIYRRLYYTFTSNMKWWQFSVITIVLPTVSFTLAAYLGSSKSGIRMDLLHAHVSSYAAQTEFLAVNNDRVEDSRLEVSLIHTVRYEKPALLKWKDAVHAGNVSSFEELDLSQQQTIIDSLYVIHLDGKSVGAVESWQISRLDNSSSLLKLEFIRLRKTIDLSEVPPGNHALGIRVNLDEETMAEANNADYEATKRFYVLKPVRH